MRAVDDDAVLADGYTAADGSYEITFEGDGDAYVLVTAQGRPGTDNHAVRDCPMGDCGGDGHGNLHGFVAPDFAPAARTDQGQTLITVASGTAGAFNIFDTYMRGGGVRVGR